MKWVLPCGLLLLPALVESLACSTSLNPTQNSAALCSSMINQGIHNKCAWIPTVLSRPLLVLNAPAEELWLYWDQDTEECGPRDSSKQGPRFKLGCYKWLMNLYCEALQQCKPDHKWELCTAEIHKEGLIQCCSFHFYPNLVNQLWVLVPFLPRDQKNWHHLAAKHYARQKTGICLFMQLARANCHPPPWHPGIVCFCQ